MDRSGPQATGNSAASTCLTQRWQRAGDGDERGGDEREWGEKGVDEREREKRGEEESGERRGNRKEMEVKVSGKVWPYVLAFTVGKDLYDFLAIYVKMSERCQQQIY